MTSAIRGASITIENNVLSYYSSEGVYMSVNPDISTDQTRPRSGGSGYYWDRWYSETVNINASSTDTIDLTDFTDSIDGSAVEFSQVSYMALKNTGSVELLLGGNVSNPFIGFLGATSQMKVPAGASVTWIDGNTTANTSGAENWDIENAQGSAGVMEVRYLGLV